MDHKKAKITLGKLNVLFNSLEEAGEEISKIEKDLMLNYIKQLYEAVLHPDSFTIPKLPDPANVPSREKNQEAVEPKVYLPEEPTLDIKAKQNNRIEINGAPEPEIENTEGKIDEGVTIDESLADLFSIEEATDLSQKLGLMPIKDLKKSMGINEKIFTVKELFNGDQKLFDECLDALNGFSNFEDAKKFLAIGPAMNFDWSEKEKQKKAKTFIRLIHRRYQ